MRFENILNISEKDNSIYVELLCDLTLEYSRKLQVNFQIVLDTIQKNMELDLKNVLVVDSSGLTVLLLLYKTLGKKGLTVKLVNVSDNTKIVLKAASLTSIFDIEV